jgi:hypothetical protein
MSTTHPARPGDDGAHLPEDAHHQLSGTIIDDDPTVPLNTLLGERPRPSSGVTAKLRSFAVSVGNDDFERLSRDRIRRSPGHRTLVCVTASNRCTLLGGRSLTQPT